MAAERGWLVLSGDYRIRYLPAFRANPVAVFALPRGGLAGHVQVARITGHISTMAEIAETTPRPFLACIYADGVEVVA